MQTLASCDKHDVSTSVETAMRPAAACHKPRCPSAALQGGSCEGQWPIATLALRATRKAAQVPPPNPRCMPPTSPLPTRTQCQRRSWIAPRPNWTAWRSSRPILATTLVHPRKDPHNGLHRFDTDRFPSFRQSRPHPAVSWLTAQRPYPDTGGVRANGCTRHRRQGSRGHRRPRSTDPRHWLAGEPAWRSREGAAGTPTANDNR